jgi:hypothetical protein
MVGFMLGARHSCSDFRRSGTGGGARTHRQIGSSAAHLAYLDPAQREHLQDEDTWVARQLFVGDLIDQILAVPPEEIT